MKTLSQKVILMLFILALAIPNFGTAMGASNKSVIDKILVPEWPNVEEVLQTLPEPQTIEAPSVEGAVYSGRNQLLQSFAAKSAENQSKRMKKSDRYTYTKKDLEQLILNGATEEDIYRSDLLANEWLTDPKALIARKTAEQKSWDEIENELSSQNEEKLKTLIDKTPKAQTVFGKKVMSTAEKIEMLEASQSEGRLLEQTLQNYERVNADKTNTSLEESEIVRTDRSVIKTVYEGSVMSNVYGGDSFKSSSLKMESYASSSNDIYNGLIGQVQINQTNKPQYANQNATSEMVDPASGKLVWKENEISLPGRDGLDLDISTMYQSNLSYGYEQRAGGSSGEGIIAKANYLLSRYDLGLGWSFQFPSIQLAGGYLYYHKGDGAVYRIEFNAYASPDNYTHLVGYQGKDMKLMQDSQGIFSNGSMSSAYYLEYANKKREYFDANGYLLGIVDRFGNKITFQYIDRVTFDDQNNKVISSITDSVGRTVTFSYETKLRDVTFSTEKIIVVVKDMNGIESQPIIYNKGRVKSAHQGIDNYFPTLWYITKQDSSYIEFNYDYFTSKFHYTIPNDTQYSGSTWFAHIMSVKYRNSYTKYGYEKVSRRLGTNGFTDGYRVISRNDQIIKNGVADGDYNHINYTYTNDYTGYDPLNPYYNPSTYTYNSKQTIQSTSVTNGLSTTTNFNNLSQVTSVVTRAANGERNETENKEFNSNYPSLPTMIENRVYANDNDTSPNVLYTEKQYTDWGGILSETAPLTNDQKNSPTIKSKYTKSYIYDPTYYFITSQTSYQNDSTLQSQQYGYYSDGRMRSFTNAKGETTNYCYESVNGSSNCSNPNAGVTGKVSKIKASQNLGNGQTSILETIFTAETDYAYPSQSKSYFTTTDASGNPLSQVLTKSMTYKMVTGLLDAVTDSNGSVTSYEYDALGRTTRIVYPSFTNANNVQYAVADEITYLNTTVPTTALAENASVGVLYVATKRKYMQVATNTTTYLSEQYDYYDGLGFLRYSKVYSSGGYQTSQYRSDDQNRPIYALDPMNNTTSVAYDVWGRQSEATDSYGNLYISENRLKQRQGVSYFVAAASVNTYRKDTANNSLKSNYVEQDYDQWGQRLVTRVYPEWPNTGTAYTELYNYDIAGNLISYTDPKRNLNNENVTAKYKYDILNRLTEVKDALGQITKYQYNVSGQIASTTVQASETDTQQVIHSKSYNEVGGISSTSDPSGSQQTYRYDSSGQLIQSTDRNGTQFNYQYDEQNRPKLLTATGGGVIQQSKTIIGSNSILTDTAETYKNGAKTASQTTTIDSLKRVTNIQVQGVGSAFTSTLGLSYDLNNRITQSSIGASSASFYTKLKYDKLRLDRVQTNGSSSVNDSDSANVKYQYYPNGQVWKVTYPPLVNGSILETEYVYDQLNRVSSITNKKGTTVISSSSYVYDANGNVTTATQTALNQASKSSSYVYDKLNRLSAISRNDGTLVTYTYDVRGNRLTLTDTSSSNPIFEDTDYQYDLSNMLIGLTKGTTQTTFDYSPDGMRYRKTKGTEVTQYRYNANREVISEVNGSNAVTANYVRGDRLLVKKEVATGKDYYYLYNGHGDVIQMVDTNGNIVNSYAYDEWGNITQQTEQVSNAFKYAGEAYDSDTGLYYLRARYYDPSMGRFINEDTYEGQIDNPLSLNLYTYVHNNPLTNVDPTGHWCESADGKWSHPGACNGGVAGQKSTNSPGYSADFWHDGEMIYEKGKEVGIYEHIEGAHEDHTWTGMLFDTLVGGVGTLGKSLGKKLIQKVVGSVTEDFAAQLAYQGARNASVDFMKYKRGELVSTLTRHFNDHAAEFGFKTETEYLNAASNFLTKKATSTTKSFTSAEGTYFRYDTATNEFGIINKFGGVSTYMKPIDGIEYWLRESAKYISK